MWIILFYLDCYKGICYIMYKFIRDFFCLMLDIIGIFLENEIF